MRLLSTENPDRPELVEVAEEAAPTYAILSHTWGAEEVTFQDIQNLSRRQWSLPVSKTVSTIQAKKGFIKIQKAAALAAEHGYSFIWVDTCCIDKTSSAEMSEAINSMFRWYQKASICYAYMEDVKHGYHEDRADLFLWLCQHSRWFTRGWTLQELIAPEDVIFYGQDWGYLGSKAYHENVRISLADITGIDIRVLEGIVQPGEISIAGRMKWASRRKTTRIEDAAYCLMGLFDVNMPLLYGEGTKAFIRLQEEILKDSNDHSIFAWTSLEDSSNQGLSGLLAESPQHFADAENYRPMPPLFSRGSTTWSMTNQGLRLSLFLIPLQSLNSHNAQDEYDAVLECAIRHGDEAYRSPAIRMRRLYGDQFARVDPQRVKSVATPSFEPGSANGRYEVVFVKQKPVHAAPDFMLSYSNIIVPPESQGPDPPCYIIGVWPEQCWDNEAAILRTTRSNSNRIAGLFRFFCPANSTTVDLAVGSKPKAGATWTVWHLQRLWTGEALHQAASSVNDYLATTNLDSQKPVKPADWLIHPWEEGLDTPRIRFQIEEIKIHGRLYHFIKALSAFELIGDKPKAPPSNLSDLDKHPTEDTTTPMQKPVDLDNLFGDMTTENSLDHYLHLRSPTSMSVASSKIRTTWAQSPTEDLENLEIQWAEGEETDLLDACRYGLVQMVPGLIHRGVESTALFRPEPFSAIPLTFNGFRPIHWAVFGGHINVITILLNNGAEFYSKTTQGWSPIHLAALFGRFVTMKWLIEYAIDNYSFAYDEEFYMGDRKNILGETPLHLAVSHITCAVDSEHRALTDILSNIGDSKLWTSPNHAGETPLHRLAASSSVIPAPIMDKFVSNASQLWFPSEYVDGHGRTVLWHAVCAGSVSIVEHLIRDGVVDLSMRDKDGFAPLHVACRLGHADVVRTLLAAGADPDVATSTLGLTGAHYAALYGHISCLRLLIDHGADVHRPSELRGISFRPIHLAIPNQRWEAVSMLQDAGADMDWRCTHFIYISSRSNGISPRFHLVPCTMNAGAIESQFRPTLSVQTAPQHLKSILSTPKKNV